MHTCPHPSSPQPSESHLTDPASVIRPYRKPDPDRFAANEEPPLEELLSDPLIWTLMASDNLPCDTLRAEIENVRARLAD